MFSSVIKLIFIDLAMSAAMFMTSAHDPLDNFNLLGYVNCLIIKKFVHNNKSNRL